MNSFPLGYLRHILSEEIKAVLHVRNDGLWSEKVKTSFLQELLDQGLISPSIILSIYCDDEVIRVTDEIDGRVPHLQGLETFPAGYFSCQSRSSRPARS